MNKYEELCQIATDDDVEIINYTFTSDRIKGLYCDGTIALDSDMYAESERTCVLAEELGHHYTSSGNIIDQSMTGNRKQELIARTWAYNKLIGLSGIIDAYKAGCRNKSEMAEHLNVTEEFLTDALERYRNKYGTYATVNNYIIYFEPFLGVLEIQK